MRDHIFSHSVIKYLGDTLILTSGIWCTIFGGGINQGQESGRWTGRQRTAPLPHRRQTDGKAVIWGLRTLGDRWQIMARMTLWSSLLLPPLSEMGTAVCGCGWAIPGDLAPGPLLLLLAKPEMRPLVNLVLGSASRLVGRRRCELRAQCSAPWAHLF